MPLPNDNPTNLALCIGVVKFIPPESSLSSLLVQIQALTHSRLQVKARLFDWLELRWDTFEAALSFDPLQIAKHTTALIQALHVLQKPLLLTLRSTGQGGMSPCFESYEQFRMKINQILQLLATLPIVAIDAEAPLCQSVQLSQIAHDLYPHSLVISHHGFKKPPHPLHCPPDHASADLTALYKILTADPITPHQKIFYKIAWECDSTLEALTFLSTVETLQKPYPVALTAIPMGKAGTFARILATRLGFRLQYFPFNMAAQYGQLDITYARSVFEIHHQTTRSQVFGLIGHPTNHSIGHLFHNKVFQTHTGFKSVYLKWNVKPHDLGLVIPLMMDLLNLNGLSITTPFKKQILSALPSQADLKRSSPINTLHFDCNTQHQNQLNPSYPLITACNTDGVGCLKAIQEGLNQICLANNCTRKAAYPARSVIGILGLGQTACGILETLINEEPLVTQEVIVFVRDKAKALQNLACLSETKKISITLEPLNSVAGWVKKKNKPILQGLIHTLPPNVSGFSGVNTSKKMEQFFLTAKQQCPGFWLAQCAYDTKQTLENWSLFEMQYAAARAQVWTIDGKRLFYYQAQAQQAFWAKKLVKSSPSTKD